MSECLVFKYVCMCTAGTLGACGARKRHQILFCDVGSVPRAASQRWPRAKGRPKCPLPPLCSHVCAVTPFYQLSHGFCTKVSPKVLCKVFSIFFEAQRKKTKGHMPCGPDPRPQQGVPLARGWQMLPLPLCAREAALACFCQVSKTGGAAKTNNRGMRVNSSGALRCETNPWNETSRMLLGIARMSNILSRWKDRREGGTEKCGRRVPGWTGKGPKVSPGRVRRQWPFLTHLVRNTPCHLVIKNNMAIKRSYQKSPCSL